MPQKVTIERTLQLGSPDIEAETELPDVFEQPGEFFRQAFNIGLTIAIGLGMVLGMVILVGLILFGFLELGSRLVQ